MGKKEKKNQIKSSLEEELLLNERVNLTDKTLLMANPKYNKEIWKMLKKSNEKKENLRK